MSTYYGSKLQTLLYTFKVNIAQWSLVLIQTDRVLRFIWIPTVVEFSPKPYAEWKCNRGIQIQSSWNSTHDISLWTDSICDMQQGGLKYVIATQIAALWTVHYIMAWATIMYFKSIENIVKGRYFMNNLLSLYNDLWLECRELTLLTLPFNHRFQILLSAPL